MNQALLQGGGQPRGPRLDANGDGQVTYEEFQNYQAFRALDANGDGVLSPQELAAAVAQGTVPGGPQMEPPPQVGMPPPYQNGAGMGLGGAAAAAGVGGMIAGAAAAAHGLPGMHGGHSAPLGIYGPLGAGNAMEMFRTLNIIEIKEQANVVEEVTAVLGAEVNMANVYNIYDATGQNLIFRATEKTSTGDRQCQNCACCRDCAAWEVGFTYHPQGAADQRGIPFLHMERQWKCACCCLNRPTAHVKSLTGDGGNLGKLRDPCTCGRLKFDLEIGEDKLHLDGGWPCCQCGWCCPLPCGPCARIRFDIEDAEAKRIATIERQIPNCALWWAGASVDNYRVDYLDMQQGDEKKKAMIMAMAVFMDFRYFNKPKKQRAGGSVQ